MDINKLKQHIEDRLKKKSLSDINTLKQGIITLFIILNIAGLVIGIKCGTAHGKKSFLSSEEGKNYVKLFGDPDAFSYTNTYDILKYKFKRHNRLSIDTEMNIYTVHPEDTADSMRMKKYEFSQENITNSNSVLERIKPKKNIQNKGIIDPDFYTPIEKKKNRGSFDNTKLVPENSSIEGSFFNIRKKNLTTESNKPTLPLKNINIKNKDIDIIEATTQEQEIGNKR